MYYSSMLASTSMQMLCSSTCAMFWSLGPRGARYLMTAFCNKRCRAAMHCVGPVHATLEQYWPPCECTSNCGMPMLCAGRERWQRHGFWQAAKMRFDCIVVADGHAHEQQSACTAAEACLMTSHHDARTCLATHHAHVCCHGCETPDARNPGNRRIQCGKLYRNRIGHGNNNQDSQRWGLVHVLLTVIKNLAWLCCSLVMLQPGSRDPALVAEPRGAPKPGAK